MRILIVEDERVIAQRLERFIREQAPQRLTAIHRCTTLQEANAWLESNRVDAVFLDLNLHGKDGFELVKDAVTQYFHTIVVSAHTERAIEAFEIGVLDFIGKPFSADRIKKGIGATIGGSRRPPG